MPSLSQNCKEHLFTGDYIHVKFSRDKKDCWPIFFEAIMKEDSISANLEDLDGFVKSLYSIAAFVPTSPYMYFDTFASVFGCSKYDESLYYDVNAFINDYYTQFERLEKKGKIKLDTGDTLEYSFFNIRGVFSEIDKRKYIHPRIDMKDSSDGIRLSQVNRIIIPIAISCYKVAEKQLVIISQTHEKK